MIDMASLLEDTADRVRSGQLSPEAAVGVFLTPTGEVEIFCWGDEAGEIYSLGLLQLGIAAILQRRADD